MTKDQKRFLQGRIRVAESRFAERVKRHYPIRYSYERGKKPNYITNAKREIKRQERIIRRWERDQEKARSRMCGVLVRPRRALDEATLLGDFKVALVKLKRFEQAAAGKKG